MLENSKNNNKLKSEIVGVLKKNGESCMAMSFATYAEIERMLWKNECLIEIEQEALGTMVGNLRET